MSKFGPWLEQHGLGKYTDLLIENEIDFDVLDQITLDELKELGIPLGARKRILKAIAAGIESGPSEGPSQSASTTARTSEAERRQLTVMFCDLVGSTALSQRLDPEDLREVITAFQIVCARAISSYDGYIARYMGDGVLAYFGYPQAYEDNAERAIRAALGIIGFVSELDASTTVPVDVRIGIATGEVVVGDIIGEGASEERAALGRTPNLAARLQGTADPGQILIDATTEQLVGSAFQFDTLAPQVLKGFDGPVPAWRVLGESAAESRFDALRGVSLSPLVGREHELASLLDRWETAKDGLGQVILLSGEAGIGKSRMLRALANEIRGERPYILRYQCSPYQANSAFYPIIQRLERDAGIAAADSAQAKLDKLEALLAATTDNVEVLAPIFAAFLSLPGEHRYAPLDLTPQQLRDQTIQALVEQILVASRRRPMIFVLEDAHWIDPSTELLTGELLSRANEAPLMMLITHRPEYDPPWKGHAHQTSMPLGRLNRRQVALIVRDVFDRELSDELVKQIIDRAEGVPLFVEELAKSLAESAMSGLEENSRAQVPETLQALLISRLDRLGTAKIVAQIGAVIGREFSFGLLAAAVDLTAAELHTALDRIVASELIFRRGTGTDAVYTFKHALIQDAAYESLLMSRRRELHGTIADTLLTQFSATAEREPALIAYHLTESGDNERAYSFWSQAGRFAVERFAYPEAIANLTKSLELQRVLPVTPALSSDELDAQIILGRIYMATKGYASAEAERAYGRARDLCQVVGDEDRLKPILVGLRYVNQIQGKTEVAREVGEELLALANQTCDKILGVQSNVALGQTASISGQFETARIYLRQAIEDYQPEQHATYLRLSGLDAGVFGRSIAGMNYWFLGYPDAALESSDAAIALAETHNHPQSYESALNNAAYVHLLRRETAQVLRRIDAATEICEEHGFRFRIAMARVFRGWALISLNDYEHGIAELDTGLKAYVESGAGTWLVFYYTLLSEGYCRAGRTDDGMQAVHQALELSTAPGERWWDSECHRTRGQLLELGGRQNFELAQASYEYALKIAREQAAKSWELRAATSLARLWRLQGKMTDAAELLQPVYDWFTEGFDTPDLMDAKTLLGELDLAS